MDIGVHSWLNFSLFPRTFRWRDDLRVVRTNPRTGLSRSLQAFHPCKSVVNNFPPGIRENSCGFVVQVFPHSATTDRGYIRVYLCLSVVNDVSTPGL